MIWLCDIGDIDLVIACRILEMILECWKWDIGIDIVIVLKCIGIAMHMMSLNLKGMVWLICSGYCNCIGKTLVYVKWMELSAIRSLKARMSHL